VLGRISYRCITSTIVQMGDPHTTATNTAETPVDFKPTGIANGVDMSTENRTWRSYIWDTWGKSPEERRLVRKIDCTLVVFGFLGTFSKFIDRANLQTAFVSGMKEELSLYGNELNYANTAYNVGMIIALWPSSLLLVRMNPKYFIPYVQHTLDWKEQ
jgi:ACS family pantothenate transporter-like MFS transporter